MHNLTLLNGLFGGALIGLAAAGLMLFTGRLAGVSGILGGLLMSRPSDRAWRIAFVTGLIAAPLVAALAGAPLPRPPIASSLALVAVAACSSDSAPGWETAAPRATGSAASRDFQRGRSWRPSSSWARLSSRSRSSVTVWEDSHAAGPGEFRMWSDLRGGTVD